MHNFCARLILSVFSYCFIAFFAEGADVLGIKGEKHTSVGIYIKDIKADTVVYEVNADCCLTPASITKAYTAASALNLLNTDFRFRTRVYYTGKIDASGVLKGNVIIKASGDPTLESEHFSKNTGFLQKIIDELKKNNVTRIEGDVVLERVAENRQYQEGPLDTWNINDICWTYGCGVFDFNWCDNYFGLYPATGKTTSPTPKLKYTVWDRPWKDGLNLIRGIYSDSLIIVGKNYRTDPKARVTTSMPYPFDVFKAKLTARLKAENIALTGKRSSSSERTLLVTHASPKLDDILRSLMVRSDNMFAEGILRALGDQYGNRNASLSAEQNLWKSKGLTPEFNRIYDGSGLSRTNAVSPRFLGDVLEWMAKSALSARYLKLFPVSGYDGTMRNFLADTPLKGRMALKTGSLNAVQCYAGYMTDRDGQPSHIVVVMVNNFYCSRNELKESIKKLLLTKLDNWINN